MEPKLLKELTFISETTIDKINFVAQLAKDTSTTAAGRPDLTNGFARSWQILKPDTASTLNIQICQEMKTFFTRTEGYTTWLFHNQGRDFL